MQDFNQLLGKFRAGDPQLAALAQFMRTQQGQKLAQSVSPATSARISRAAQCAQRGDTAGAQAAVNEILRTPEGAALAAKLKYLIQK